MLTQMTIPHYADRRVAVWLHEERIATDGDAWCMPVDHFDQRALSHLDESKKTPL